MARHYIKISMDIRILNSNNQLLLLIATSCILMGITPQVSAHSPCDSDPCLHGGTCFTSAWVMSHYMCSCQPGYTGINCEATICSANEYLCPAGNCVDFSDVCNTVKDCPDASDEMHCEPVPDCRADYERCPSPGNAVCIHPTWRCDGFDDCGDNSDENEAWCYETACPDDMVKCTNSGACLPGRYLCDGVVNCQDNSAADEPLENCTSAAFTCPSNHFHCHNGLCIPEHWVCDDDDDCGDGSDETSLDCAAVTCRPGYFRCKRNLVRRSVCLPEVCLCDEIAHCEGAIDELPPICESPSGSCDTESFQCANDLCIHESWVCDFENDCGDNSDEGDGCVYPDCSPATEFTCANGRCIRRDFACDGVNDCHDMSDESAELCAEISMSSCGYLRNNEHGEFDCNGNSHGSVCSFSCSRGGYSLCPGMPQWWTCQDGSWDDPTSPRCCDIEPPTLTCPEPIEVDADENVTFAVVQWKVPEVEDNSGETLVADEIRGRAPGSHFDWGKHTIQYQATDSAHNTATCEFYVDVRVHTCVLPPPAPNMKRTCSREDFYIYGTTCRFECEQGWCTDGPSTVECEKLGTNDYSFIGVQPTCRAIQCPALPIPANGFMSHSCSTDFNGICTFTCKPGFTLQGSVHRECGQSADTPCIGTWSGEETICVANTVVTITCPPDMIMFAQENDVTTPVIWNEPWATDSNGNSVSVEQTDGIPKGDPFPQGLHTIEYTAMGGATCSFTIDVRVHRCNVLTSRANQQMTCTSGNLYGSVCSFTCNDGYRLTGTPSVKCEITSMEWIGEQPTCSQIDDIEVTITCPLSWIIYAPQESISAAATWTEPSAIDNNGNSVSVKQTAGVPKSDRLQLPEGLYSIEYTADDGAGHTATCSFTIEVRVHRCNALIAGDNQQMTCTHSNIYGSECYFTCHDGYCLTGNPNSVTCTAVDWSGEQPTCMPIRCEALTPPYNGFTIGTCEATHGSVCTFGCNSGYQMEGDSTRQCSSFPNGPPCLGMWTGQPTVCRETQPITLTCPPSITQYAEPSDADATVTWTEPQVMVSGEVVAATLREGNPEPGSKLSVGQHIITYEVSNAGNVHQCSFTVTVIARCPSLSPTNNQRMTCSNDQSNIVVGSSCEFTCDFGWCLESTYNTLTCSNGGTASDPRYSWNQDLPVCKPVTCPALQPPLNSQPIGICDNTHGSTCSFACNSGYLSIGSTSRRCTADTTSCLGMWSEAPSSCHDIESPTITCPDSIARNIASTETTIVVTWSSPMVTDNSNENIEPELKTIDKPSGFTFTEGTHMIEYEARDLGGNIASCSFFIVVNHETPSTCEPLMPTQNQEMSCSNTYNVGSTCTFTCKSGYCSDHSNSVVCEKASHFNQWSGVQPTCREVTCQPLAPPANAEILSGDATCTTSPCRMACKDGYTPIGGNRMRTCQHMRGATCHTVYWDGQELQCQDTQRPQFINCPDSIPAQASKYNTMAFVQWNIITAKDNSGVVFVTCDKQEGYMTEGNHPLNCVATDGTGNQATCDTTITVTVRRCPAIVSEIPQHANVDQSRCHDHYGGSCSIQCQDGYTLQGSSQATCEYEESQTRMYWSWVQTPTCTMDVTHCSPLLSAWSSSGIQQHCTLSNNIGSMCTLSCSSQGYTLQNSPVQIVCQEDGAWNIDVTILNPRCLDTQPPSIDQCPTEPVEGELSPNTLQAEVLFMIPQASDNSQEVLTVITTPVGVTSPHYFDSDTWVSYQFFDAAGNSDTCSFKVFVKNSLPPAIVSCPVNMEFDSMNEVNWEVPRFENPHTKEPITSVCDKYPNDALEAGENAIKCTATNPDSNVEGVCEFSITVGADSLSCRALPPITDGYWKCNLHTCTLLCNEGFDIPKNPTRIYTCGDNGWLPRYPGVLKCAATIPPKGVVVSSNTTGTTSTECPSEDSDIGNTVEDQDNMAKQDPQESCTRCKVEDATGNCEKEAVQEGRSKRSTHQSKLTVCFKVLENELQQDVGRLEKLNEEKQKLREYAMKIISQVGNVFKIESADIELIDTLICEPGYVEGSNGLGCVCADDNVCGSGGTS